MIVVMQMMMILVNTTITLSNVVLFSVIVCKKLQQISPIYYVDGSTNQSFSNVNLAAGVGINTSHKLLLHYFFHTQTGDKTKSRL